MNNNSKARFVATTKAERRASAKLGKVRKSTRPKVGNFGKH